jgi:predicted Zn-dependent protease with MMP-like domain
MDLRGGSVKGRSRSDRGPVIDIPADRFEALVGDALDSIPDELAACIDNVAVFVEDRPRQLGLLGLYQGIPLTRRDAGYAGMVVPDRITIYREPICALCSSEAEVVRQVQVTVLHEVAHHFGISDERLRQLGYG